MKSKAPTLILVTLVVSTPLVATPQPKDLHADCPMAKRSETPPPLPELVGQDAFAAIAEMRALLDSAPGLDWSRVDLDAFRDHLVDMNRVVLHAEVETRKIDGGFESTVRGSGRTVSAIRRMVPAHARYAGVGELLTAAVTELEDGVRISVTTSDPDQVARIRGLGFFGFLASGDHHRPHHRVMALGGTHP